MSKSELLDHASKVNELTVSSKMIYLETLIIAIKQLDSVDTSKLITRKGKYCAINYEHADPTVLRISKCILRQTQT